MSSENAIEIKNLSLKYKLYPSPIHMALDIFKLRSLFPWKKFDFPIKNAVDDLNLVVRRGDRIGLIGRNGAGKTSLLKVITGILSPTSGSVVVRGKVQSLLTSGLGFDPNLTGLQNVKSSLVYNGLTGNDFDLAVKDIVDFCELGDYIDQPIKTYSLGMQSRLAFATSTAIKPDILIIDEVLGAGDAYFINKCVARVKRLTSSHDTTLILVSHSTTQILQFCDQSIWIDNGRVLEAGPSIEIVKKYDKFINDLQSRKIEETNLQKNSALMSRWTSENKGVAITDFKISDSRGKTTAQFNSGDAAIFTVGIGMTETIEKIFPVVMAYSDSGVTAIFCYGEHSPKPGQTEFKLDLAIDGLNLGPGEYHLSVALYKTLDLNDLNNSVFYDLIDRSYRFVVIDPLVKNNPAIVKLSYKWSEA